MPPPSATLAMLATRYDAGMDNNPALKDAALFMAGNCPEGARFTLNAPPHVVSFYLDAVAESLDGSTGQPLAGPACVLYNAKKNAQLPVALMNATRVQGGDTSFGVWRIPEGAP